MKDVYVQKLIRLEVTLEAVKAAIATAVATTLCYSYQDCTLQIFHEI